MSKNKVIFLLGLVWAVTMFSGCTSESNPQQTGNQKNDLAITVEDVKKSYSDSEIVNITSYGNHVLVESHKDTLANRFDWYNLKTGDKDTLPTVPYYVTLEEIVDQEQVLFYADGRNHINGYRAFPFTVKSIRDQENLGSEGDFRQEYWRKYLPLDREARFGGGGRKAIGDVRISFDGLEVLFEPVPGLEAEFFATRSRISSTKTSYLENDGSFIIQFKDTVLSSKLKEELNNKSANRYLESYKLAENNGDTELTLKLRAPVNFYSATTHHLPIMDSDLPFVSFHFAEEEVNEYMPYYPEG